MKQILQSLKNGQTAVENLPCPALKPGHLLIRTHKTLISAGTERMLLEFGRSNYIGKAIKQPDKLKLAIEKIKTDGLAVTFEAILRKLNEPIPLGYCNIGSIVGIGKGVIGFNIGDRVVSNGSHAEVVCVPKNLCVKVPDSVSDNNAVFAILGAIALQGIRLTAPTIGESIGVIGLGLVGLLTVEILKAQGCKVIGIDIDEEKIVLAKSLGIEPINLKKISNPESAIKGLTNNFGLDGVIITASSKSNEPIEVASKILRQRGRIILVGVSGLNISRENFYNKEITFQTSRSYGPGRYDDNYEKKGFDYPIGYVRWTENRNIQAIIELLESKKINPELLITKEFHIDDAKNAFEFVFKNNSTLGVVLNYPKRKDEKEVFKKNKSLIGLQNRIIVDQHKIQIGFIGAGNYAKILLKSFKKTNVNLNTIISNQGITGLSTGKKFNFDKTSTDSQEIFDNKEINTVVICTQHDSHARYIIEALNANKNVFVEKPIALELSELDEIESTLIKSAGKFTVGYNRRFSPHVKKIKSLISDYKIPKSINMMINSGKIEDEHWIHDKDKGGGRLIGEACHFVDLCRHIIGHKIINSNLISLDNFTNDTFSIQLTFLDGSIATINYFSNGHISIPKERLELYVDNKILILDNYRKLTGYGWSNFKSSNLWKQNKGQDECIASFIHSLENNKIDNIPYDELIEVGKILIQLNQ